MTTHEDGNKGPQKNGYRKNDGNADKGLRSWNEDKIRETRATKDINGSEGTKKATALHRNDTDNGDECTSILSALFCCFCWMDLIQCCQNGMCCGGMVDCGCCTHDGGGGCQCDGDCGADCCAC